MLLEEVIDRPESGFCIDKLVEEGFYYNAGTLRTVPVKIGGTSWIPGIPNRIWR